MRVDRKNIKRLEPRFGKQAPQIEDPSLDGSEPAGTESPELDAQETPTIIKTIATPTQPKRGWNFISNHWRGLYSLGTSYWLFGFIASIISAIGVLVIQSLFATDDGYQPVLIFFTLMCIWLFVGILTLWQLVGVWRSANRNHEQNRLVGRRASWSGVAKFMVIIGLLRALASFAEAGVPQLQETYRMGFMGDPDLPAYSMRIMRNGTEAEITGGFKYGLTESFKNLLSASPQLKVVHLNSIGGRIGEAIKLNKVIRDAGLKTYVSNFCASACTVAFAGGTQRWLYQSASLGFHGPAFPGMNQAELNASNDAQRSTLVRSGYNAAFVNKALAIPSKDLWRPTIAELSAANVITAVSNGTQFASSGYGGNIQEEVFAEPLSDNVPILGALKDRYPEDFSKILNAYYKSYVDGGTEEDDNNIARFYSYAAVRKYLETADDQSLRDFGKLLAAELEILQTRDAVQCAKFGSVSGADPDIQYSFASPVMRKFQTVGSAVIRTSPTRSDGSDDQAKMLLNRTIAALGTRLPPRLIALLSVQKPTDEQATDYCAAILGLYQQINTAPPMDAAIMLRFLM